MNDADLLTVRHTSTVAEELVYISCSIWRSVADVIRSPHATDARTLTHGTIINPTVTLTRNACSKGVDSVNKQSVDCMQTKCTQWPFRSPLQAQPGAPKLNCTCPDCGPQPLQLSTAAAVIWLQVFYLGYDY